MILALNWVAFQLGEASDPVVRKPPIAARIENLREAPSSLYCECNNIPGRDLVFDLVVQNKSNVQKTVYAFIWATNDNVNPPERSLWPVSAVNSCLTETGELDVSDPRTGKKIELAAGGLSRLKGKTILQPIGWFEGELVRFQKLRIEIWLAGGGRIFVREQKLSSRLPFEERAKATAALNR
jgi:hypothetical protein